MEATIHLDDTLAQRLGVRSQQELSDRALRSLLAEAYRRERLGRHEVGQILNLDRWQTEEFLAEHDAQRPYSWLTLHSTGRIWSVWTSDDHRRR